MLLALIACAALSQPCVAEVEEGRVVACGSGPGFDAHAIEQSLPEQARGDLLLVAEHQQVMIIETDINHDFQPLIVVSRTADQYFVTSERDDGRKPAIRTSPLSGDLGAKINAAMSLALAEARAEPDGAVGWEVRLASGKCILVVHDMFRTVMGGGPSHWVVAMLDGLIELAEARSKLARGKAESAIRTALPAG